MHDPFARRAQATPDRTALIDADAGRHVSYGAFDEQIDRTAAWLAAEGVGPGEHVGMLIDTSVTAVRLVHAVARLGARLVPLSTRLSTAELVDAADAAELDWCVRGTDVELDDDALDQPVVVPEIGGSSTPDPASVARATWARDDTFVLPLTSGTTGRPKAVRLTLGNVLASATASAWRLGVQPSDRWLVPLPVYHLGGLAPVYRTALYGTAVVPLADTTASRIENALASYSPSGISLVPTLLRRLFDAEVHLEELRFVLLGGAPARTSLIDACRDRDVSVYPTYGATETASQIATATPEEAFGHAGTVGRPLAGTDVTIHGEDGRRLPPDEIGEIVVAGPTVANGYHGLDDDRSFESGRFMTGDAGYLSDGRLWVVGRLDDRITTGGETVYPAEVEAVLVNHPDVREAAVVGLDDEEWGQRVAALVVKSDPALDGHRLRAHCRDRLSDFKFPRTIRFADEVPRTASGTVDRQAVRGLLE